MDYLHWSEKTITDFSDIAITAMYERGFVFTRKGKGVVQQTRSCRVDLSKFEMTSENRRILKKTDDISLEIPPTELPLYGYDWQIGKEAKDFYDKKFEPGIMSAQKVKMMLVEKDETNFNYLFRYIRDGTSIGYAICYADKNILHYCYPFYSLDEAPKDMGLGMMIRAIQYAKDARMKYAYLGSLQRPGDTYKLQFEGLEWFDGKKWQTDLETAKALLK